MVAVLSSSTIQAEKARRSFELFIKDAWPTLEPGTPLQWNWHVSALAIHLQALYERRITKLIIGLAPGHAKSTIVSQMFPVWCWINDPFSRWLCASHSLDLSLRDNVYRRRLIESDWFQENYGHIFQFAGDQNVKSFFQNDKQGYMMALAVRSSGTGKRATALLIDDANNAMAGKADQEATVEWHSKTWTSRINDQQKGMQVVVGQRLGEEDLIGHLLKQGGWEHLCLPEEFESARRCRTLIGWTDPRTQEGELLWPEKFPRRVLEHLKTTQLGSMNYAAQFQQSPVPSSGGQFKEKWFRYCSVEGDYYALETPQGIHHVAIKDCWRFTVVDLAISTKQTADWTVIQTFDVTPQNELLLIDQVRGHFDNPEQQRLIRLTYFRLKPQFVQIEAVAYQLALIQQLRDEPVPMSKIPFLDSLIPMKVGDFLVRVGSIEALDQTIRSLPNVNAFAVKDEDGKYVQYLGYWVVRVQGDIFFFKYACEHQGYCTIISDITEQDIRNYGQERDRKYSIPIREYKPVRDKVSRASAPALLMENGKFFFLKTLSDLPIIKNEYLRFPRGANDDIVDCGSQAAEVIFVPTGPVMWSIDSDSTSITRTDNTPPLQGEAARVPSVFEQDDFDDEGVTFDFEIGGGRW